MKKFFTLISALFLFSAFALADTPISITAANVTPSANARYLYAAGGALPASAAAITPGQTVYQLSDGTIGLADVDASATTAAVKGIAVTGASGAGQPILVCVYDPFFKVGATVAIGDTLWAGSTAGAITKTFADIVSGWYVTSLGVAVDTTHIFLNPTSAGAPK